MKPSFVPFVFLFVLLFASSCDQDYSPKPRGYFRIVLPEKSYQALETPCPYTFDYPTYGKIVTDNSREAEPCWMDVYFPEFNARIHLSYIPVKHAGELDKLTEDARTFAFNHTVKATAIDQQRISLADQDVYGLKYSIKGNTASGVQFYVTDSVKHYLRGALYFNEKPRIDSIQPILEFLKVDIDSLIHSVRWK